MQSVLHLRKLLESANKKNDIALTHYRLGKALFGLGLYSESVGQFNKAKQFEQLPENYRYASTLNQGKGSLCEGRTEKAKEYFNQLILAPEIPEFYRTEAARFIQYRGLIHPPPNKVTELVMQIQRAIIESDETELASLSTALSQDNRLFMESMGRMPFNDMHLTVELVLDAGENKYYIECFAIGKLGKKTIKGDFVILAEKTENELIIVDIIKIQLN
jgi:tetratricopeptide (TPR) repeat protein